MGAFENQIRENETFESLMELYGSSIETNRTLEEENKELIETLCDAWVQWAPLAGRSAPNGQTRRWNQGLSVLEDIELILERVNRLQNGALIFVTDELAEDKI